MRVPRHIDPRKLASQGTYFDGVVPTGEMVRLSEAVERLDEEAKVQLAFNFDESRHLVIEGHFSLEVSCQCQRCLQPVDQHLEGDILIGVVWTEDRLEVLPKRYDPWLVESEPADLYEMLEDEILLALPIVSYHDESVCGSAGRFSTGEIDDARQSPFDILAQLKK
jgi:uncharacterized protein